MKLTYYDSLVHCQRTFFTFVWDALCWLCKTPCCSIRGLNTHTHTREHTIQLIIICKTVSCRLVCSVALLCRRRTCFIFLFDWILHIHCVNFFNVCGTRFMCSDASLIPDQCINIYFVSVVAAVSNWPLWGLSPLPYSQLLKWCTQHLTELSMASLPYTLLRLTWISYCTGAFYSKKYSHHTLPSTLIYMRCAWL